MSYSNITPRELAECLRCCENLEMIDVRTPVEYREVHLMVARSVPLDTLDPKAVMASRTGSADQPLYVICRSGSRSTQACKKFVAAGFTNIVNVEGGTLACEALGLPVERGEKSFSLERQVRLIAGLLALIGAILGYLWHPYFMSLSALVGLGFIHAGVTDTCLMGLTLGRLPWNKCETSCCSNK